MHERTAPRHRAISNGVALATFVFALLVATGTYLRSRNIIPAVVILCCSIWFLGLWYIVRRKALQESGDVGSESGALNWHCWIAVLLALVAWGMAMGGQFVPPTSARVALIHLVVTSAACLVAFMLAIVGIGSASRPRGKGLGLVAVAAIVGLVMVVVGRMLLGI